MSHLFLLVIALSVALPVCGCQQSAVDEPSTSVAVAPSAATTSDSPSRVASSLDRSVSSAETTTREEPSSPPSATNVLAESKPQSIDNGSSNAEELEIFEATFRFQFEHNVSAKKQEANAYFIEIKGKDPSPEFLRRFAEQIPPVKNGSEFKVGEGLLFNIEGWKRVSDNEVEVSGGYYEGNLSASDNTYWLKRQNGRWTFKSDQMQWIS